MGNFYSVMLCFLGSKKWSFLFFSSLSLFVLGCTLSLSKEIDEKGIEEMKGLKNEFSRSWKLF
jgi:hypothetical protein